MVSLILQRKYGNWGLGEYENYLCVAGLNDLLGEPVQGDVVKFNVVKDPTGIKVRTYGECICADWYDEDSQNWRPLYSEAVKFLVKHFGRFKEARFHISWSKIA